MSGERILSNTLHHYINQTVLVKGWIHKKREVSSTLLFLILRDREGLVQIVVEDEGEIKKLTGMQVGSVISVSGSVVEESRATKGVEIHEPQITIVTPVMYPSPIEIDKPISHDSENFNTLFEYRVLSLRSPKEKAVFRIQSEIYSCIRQFLAHHEFTEFRSPKLLAEASEGGAETFTLEYFGKTATLAQSAQFYKQIMVGVFEKVYEIGATYRAEPSYTPRHMTEFTTLDVEMGFIESFEEVLEVAEQLVIEVVNKVWKECGNEFEMWNSFKPMLTSRFPRVSLYHLHQLYFEQTAIDLRHEKDPSPEEERFICEYSSLNWGSEAVFITEFPASEMKFYHYKNQHKPDVCERADLIFRGVEIATLSQREHRYEVLLEQLQSIGINPTHPGYKYYLQAFKHGMPPHGGFGMGLERLLQKLVGFKSVKEATLFPRDVGRLGP
jgi:nondiscriminating aspartyl-tRNA synthetase